MNEFIPNSESLSAYLDDELSPSEREQVEAWLAESEDAQTELRELRQLRVLLSSLPAEKLPESLHTAVWEQCEDQTTVASTPVDHSRRRWEWVAALVAACVVVGFAGLLATRQTSPVAPSSEVASSSIDTPAQPNQDSQPQNLNKRDLARVKETAKALGQANMDLSEQADRRVAADNERESLTAPQDKTPAAASASAPGLAKPQPRSLAARMRSANTPESPAGGAFGGGTNAALAFRDDLKKAPVGMVVEALDRSQGNVAVVRLTVVDRRQGLRDLRVLLKRHRIQPDGNGSKNDGSNNASEASTDDLLAVYVEAPSDRLASVLKALQGQESFTEMQLASAMPVTTVERLAEADMKKALDRVRVRRDSSQPADAVRKTNIDKAKKGPRRAAATDAKDAKRPAPSLPLVAKSAPLNADGKPRDIKDEELAKISRQLQLVLPRSVMRTARTYARPGEKQRKPAEADLARKEEPNAGPGTKRSHDPPLRLLFVVVERDNPPQPTKGRSDADDNGAT